MAKPRTMAAARGAEGGPTASAREPRATKSRRQAERAPMRAAVMWSSASAACTQGSRATGLGTATLVVHRRCRPPRGGCCALPKDRRCLDRPGAGRSDERASRGSRICPSWVIRGEPSTWLAQRPPAVPRTLSRTGTYPVHFKPANPRLRDRLKRIDRPFRLTSIGSTQLRLEGIDALELHFEGTHQPRPRRSGLRQPDRRVGAQPSPLRLARALGRGVARA